MSRPKRGSNPTWGEVKAHAEKAIADATTRLEQSGLPLPETEAERGAIKALRAVIALEEATPEAFRPDPD